MRISENRFNRIIKESIRNVINEAFKSNVLRGLSKPNDRYNKMSIYDIGELSSWGGYFLSDITDDMISFVGDKQELLDSGFKFNKNGNIFDVNGKKRFAMQVNRDKYIVFKNDDNTMSKLESLSSNAKTKKEKRSKNKYNDGKNAYVWNDSTREKAFDGWKWGRDVWDKEPIDSPNRNWRNQGWVRNLTDDSLGKVKESRFIREAEQIGVGGTDRWEDWATTDRRLGLTPEEGRRMRMQPTRNPYYDELKSKIDASPKKEYKKVNPPSYNDWKTNFSNMSYMTYVEKRKNGEL